MDGVKDTQGFPCEGRGCIHIVGAPHGYGLYYLAGDKPKIVKTEDVEAAMSALDRNMKYNGAVIETLSILTMPLCKIAEKLGVPGIPPGKPIPNGVWLTDGDNGYAYNWPELVDKMTERMGQ